jgi:hypothetical protein
LKYWYSILWVWMGGLLGLVTPVWGQTVIGERADTFNTGATQGVIQIDFNAYSDPDSIAIYYPPRGMPGSQAIYSTNNVTTSLATGSLVINRNFGPGASQQVEIVVNLGRAPAISTWDYSGTITGQGQPPVSVVIDPLFLPPPPPAVPKVSSTGTILHATAPGGIGFTPTQRGYMGHIISPPRKQFSGPLSPKAGASPGVLKLNPPGQVPKIYPRSGEGNFTMYLKSRPSRGVQRVTLRGGTLFYQARMRFH